MGRIDAVRVLLGGLLAGLVVNVGETILNMVIVADDMESVLQARNLEPLAGPAIAGFIVMAFALGVVMVWLYAAIRPRFGPGVRTAVIAGVVVWLLAYVWAGAGRVMMGFVPLGPATAGMMWGLGESIMATIAGAWLYTER
jgi:hypothetical protein